MCRCSEGSNPTPNDRELYIVAVGRRWPLATIAEGRVRLSYAADLLPLVVSLRTGDASFHLERCPGGGACGYADSAYPWTTTSIGAGALPIGAVVTIAPMRWMSVDFRVAGGGVQLSQPVPFIQGRKFNFIAEGAAAASIRLGPRTAFTAGVTFNHISNGGTAQVNTGMDSRMLDVGLIVGR